MWHFLWFILGPEKSYPWAGEELAARMTITGPITPLDFKEFLGRLPSIDPLLL